MTDRERVVSFGPRGSLVGILTQPPSGVPTAALLLLNAGLLQRSGPCRLHVRLARRLAGQGVTTLRFDLAGLGDSVRRGAGAGADAEMQDDVRNALEVLRESAGPLPLVAGGLCSASDLAFTVALSDDRITGLLQLDPWVHPTPMYHLRRYGPSLLRPATWLRVATGGVSLRRALGVANDAAPAPQQIDPLARPFPSRAWVGDGYRRLMARGVRALCIHSGLRWHYCNYAGQLRAAHPSVPFGDRLREIYLAGADHLFSEQRHQARVVDEIGRWIAASAA
jgi:hypothetical protein